MAIPKIEKFQSNYTDLCGNCKAEGRVWKVLEVNPHNGEERGYWTVCPLCEGTGMVSVQKTTMVIITAKKLKECSKE